MQSAGHLFLTVALCCALIAPSVPAAGSSDLPDPSDAPHSLQTDTDAAQKRLDKWDQQEAKEERYERSRQAWEIPLAMGVLLSGFALYRKDVNYAYAGAGVAGIGLAVNYWPWHRTKYPR